MLRSLEEDIGAFQELQKNLVEVGTGNGLYDLINMEVTARTRTVHNTHEEDGRLQYGVTVMASFGLVTSQIIYSGS